MQERRRKQEQQQVDAPVLEEQPADVPAPERAVIAGEVSPAPLTLAQVAAANLSEGDAAADAQVWLVTCWECLRMLPHYASLQDKLFGDSAVAK